MRMRGKNRRGRRRKRRLGAKSFRRKRRFVLSGGQLEVRLSAKVSEKYYVRRAREKKERKKSENERKGHGKKIGKRIYQRPPAAANIG